MPISMPPERRTVGGVVDLSSASTTHFTLEPALEPAIKLQSMSFTSQQPAGGIFMAQSPCAPFVKTVTLEFGPSKVRRKSVKPPVRHWNSVRYRFRGMRVWSLGYTIVGEGAPVIGLPIQSPQLTPQFPWIASRKKTTVVLPVTQPSVAVTVTTPPAFELGVRTPAAIMPGGVASARVALHNSLAGSSALVPSPNVPSALKVIGAAGMPSSFTCEFAGVSAIDLRSEMQATPASP